MPGPFFCHHQTQLAQNTSLQTETPASQPGDCRSYSQQLHQVIGKCSQIATKTHRLTSPEHVALSGYLQKNIDCLNRLKELQEQAASCLDTKSKI